MKPGYNQSEVVEDGVYGMRLLQKNAGYKTWVITQSITKQPVSQLAVTQWGHNLAILQKVQPSVAQIHQTLSEELPINPECPFTLIGQQAPGQLTSCFICGDSAVFKSSAPLLGFGRYIENFAHRKSSHSLSGRTPAGRACSGVRYRSRPYGTSGLTPAARRIPCAKSSDVVASRLT